MTKKDFVVLAEEIRNMLDPVQRLNAAAAVAAAAIRLNPRFNPQLFYAACGIVAK